MNADLGTPGGRKGVAGGGGGGGGGRGGGHAVEGSSVHKTGYSSAKNLHGGSDR